jgi:hypothetical protein
MAVEVRGEDQYYAIPGSVLMQLMRRAQLPITDMPLAPRRPAAQQIIRSVDPSNVGGMCRTPCHTQAYPGACCAVKNGVCADADCKNGAYTGRRTQRRIPVTAALPVSTKPIRVPRPAECKSWNPCAQTFAPAQCCRMKPSTCYDPNCIGGQFTMPATPMYETALDMDWQATTQPPQAEQTQQQQPPQPPQTAQSDDSLFGVDPSFFAPLV